jgi:hypothetical protein
MEISMAVTFAEEVTERIADTARIELIDIQICL